MIKSTLIYLEKDEKYLLMHRVRKKNDINKDKWIGVGGKFEPGESAEDCARRETFEETGLTIRKLNYRGIVYFENDLCESEEMHLFTSVDFSGELHQSDEGLLEWINKSDVTGLKIWAGDKIFLTLLAEDAPFFRLRLVYSADTLIRSEFLPPAEPKDAS